MSQGPVALVTGANKGIGLAIVENLCTNHPKLHVLLGARDPKLGGEALKKIQGKCSNVSSIHIDLNDEKSIKSAAESVKKQYGGLDILINNAGMAWKGSAFNTEVAATTLGTNYFGTLKVCQEFLPLMRENGRVVNVSSMVGKSTLGKMSSDLRAKFLADDLTVDQLNGLMNKFIKDVTDGTYAKEGWPETTYGVSKTGVTMLTRILARDNKTKGLLINSCCPGWVKTDMAGDKAPLTPAQGAETPVHLAFLPADAPNGKFWQNCKESSFV